MKRSALSIIVALSFFPLWSSVTQHSPTAYLAGLPAPALDASEALARTPQETDTLLARCVDELAVLAEHDTIHGTNLLRQHHAITAKVFAPIQRQFENALLAVGEQIDREIRDCPKVRNAEGKEIYQAVCVEEAERRGRLRRVAAVDDYLAQVKDGWPRYLREINAILTASNQRAWLLVLEVARNAAFITENAAQFAR